MTIIRQPTSISGAKRLGETRAPAADAGAPAAAQQAPAAPDRETVRASLREAFADELAELKEAARKEGLLTAEAEIEAVTQRLEADYQKKSAAENSRRDSELAEERVKLRALAAALTQETQELKAAAEAAALEIAFATVAKLLGEQAAERRLLTALVAQAVQEHRLSGPITVRVAAQDAEAAQAVAGTGIEFVADAALAPGDCVITFGEGRIDAGITQQLDRIREIFLESLVRHADA
jgi:flagellar biosynthesis/type III secretory pathway protein FliH